MNEATRKKYEKVREWKKEMSWPEVAQWYNETYNEEKNHDALRHWYNYHRASVEPHAEPEIYDICKESTPLIDIADKLDISPRKVQVLLGEAKNQGYEVIRDNNGIRLKRPDYDADEILGAMKKGHTSVEALSAYLGYSTSQVQDALLQMQNEAYAVEMNHHDEGTEVGVRNELERGGDHDIVMPGREITIGLVSDTHLYSKYADEELLHEAYDMFEREGIQHVYHAGNILEGEFRFNKYELVGPAGFENQVQYVVDKYPQRKGITTHFIAGDDHEGWYTKQFGVNIGQRIVQVGRDEGRYDLDYLGYFHADVKFKQPEGHATVRVVHPGGGSSYATSYKAQKYVEALPLDNRPDIVFMGHYHKSGVFEPLGTIVVLASSFQWQSLFMIKKNLRSDVAWWIIRMIQNEQGEVVRFMPERVKPPRSRTIIYGS